MKKQEGIPLKKIVAAVKIDPKNARAKLRRLKLPKGAVISGKTWTFTPKGASWVKEQLKTDMRKSA